MTTHFNLINMKYLSILLLALLVSCSTAKKCDAYSMNLGVEYDSIAVYRYSKMYIPKIPLDSASVIYFHDIVSGKYKVELYNNGQVETRKFKLK